MRPIPIHKLLALGALLAGALALPAACGDSTDTLPSTSSSGTSGCTVNGQECPVRCDPTLGCVECVDDADCGAARPICVAGACEECGVASDCATGESCYPQDHQCKPSCTDNGDCGPTEPICAPDGACVGCLHDSDCPATEPICSPVTAQCVECASDADCGAARPVCDLADGVCRECLVDAQCPSSAPNCVDHHCQDTPTPTCGSGEIDCGGDVGCVDPSTDPSHCGGCGVDCGPGGACVSGNCTCGANLIICPGDGCVDPSTDPQHCGGCNNQCDPGQDCVSGNCACVPPMQNCNGNCVDTTVDPQHCGSCDNGCGGDEYCDNSDCVCKPGLTLVQGNCIDLKTDPSNCGTPGNPCSGNTPLCQNGGCVGSCTNGTTECGNACVDTDTNPLYCGNCQDSCDNEEICVEGNCEQWVVGVGCSTCPCPSSCHGNFQQCCEYPGDPSLIICHEGNSCP